MMILQFYRSNPSFYFLILLLASEELLELVNNYSYLVIRYRLYNMITSFKLIRILKAAGILDFDKYSLHPVNF